MGKKSETNQTTSKPNSSANSSASNGTKQTNKRTNQAMSSTESSPEKLPKPKKTPLTIGDANRPVTLAELVSLLSDQTKNIQRNFNTELKALGNEIKAGLDEQLAHMNNKIEEVKSNVQAQLDVMKTDIARIQTQPNINDDDFKRIAKLNELRINGIEHTANQNLNQIFLSIANYVKFDTNNPNNIPTVMRPYRLNPTTKTKSPTPFLIVKFIANHIRDDFYSLYLNTITAKMPLMSEHINLPPGKRIVINESLTPQNASIFTAANKLKRDGKLHKMFTHAGLVHVKANNMEKATAIRSNRELDFFVHEKTNEPIQQQSAMTSVNQSNTTTNPSQHPTQMVTDTMEANDVNNRNQP